MSPGGLGSPEALGSPERARRARLVQLGRQEPLVGRERREERRGAEEEPRRYEHQGSDRQDEERRRGDGRAGHRAGHAPSRDEPEDALALGDGEELPGVDPELRDEHRPEEARPEVDRDDDGGRVVHEVEQRRPVRRAEQREQERAPPPEAPHERAARRREPEGEHRQRDVDDGEPRRRELFEEERVARRLHQRVRRDDGEEGGESLRDRGAFAFSEIDEAREAGCHWLRSLYRSAEAPPAIARARGALGRARLGAARRTARERASACRGEW
jgi:hypothetical protein